MSSNDEYFENKDAEALEDFQQFEEYYGFDEDDDEPKELEF